MLNLHTFVRLSIVAYSTVTVNEFDIWAAEKPNLWQRLRSIDFTNYLNKTYVVISKLLNIIVASFAEDLGGGESLHDFIWILWLTMSYHFKLNHD